MSGALLLKTGRRIHARMAVRHVFKMLPDGTANLASGPRKWEIKSNYIKYQEDLSQIAALQKTKEGNLTARQLQLLVYGLSATHKVGNCGEMAFMAFTWLRRHGITPIDILTADDIDYFGNHSFIAIGLPGDFKSGPVGDFDPDVVICDPWMVIRLRVDKGAETDGVYLPADCVVALKELSTKGSDVVTSYAKA